jgi:predicted phage terminase large subunit-like protein
MTDNEVLWVQQLVKCRESLPDYIYTTQNYDAIIAGTPDVWVRAKALIYVAQRVQEFLETPSVGAYKILVLSLPPQHGKSVSITETAPSWYQGNHPEARQMIISYNDDTAKPFLRKNRDKIWRFGPDVFGIDIGEVDTVEALELSNKRGSIISRGIGSGITGKPADVVWIDDPIKNRAEADSQLLRDSMWSEWNDTIKSRLSAGAKVILIMTRWHEDDLAGRILKYEKPQNVTYIRIPCEAEEGDPLGRPVGAALCPEFGKDNAWLADFKAGYQTKEGSRSWNALFQGRPTSAAGNMIKREWWRVWRMAALPEMQQTVISVDATFKDGAANDFVSIQVWGKHGADCYLLDRDHRRMDFPATLTAIRAMKSRHHKARTILIEDKANGSALISVLKKEIPGVIAVNPQGGKVSRVNAVSPAIEAGNVFLPHEDEAPWVNEFINECAAFPSGQHDDDVDAMSQALSRLVLYGNAITSKPARSSRLFTFERDEPRGMEALNPW